MLDLLGMPRLQLQHALHKLGVGEVHTNAVFKAVHKDRVPLTSVASLGHRHANTILNATRNTSVSLTSAHMSDDGTEKLVYTLEDGQRVESVLIPKGDRVTLCVSSQVGCAMACQFCATARLGLQRGLKAGEIVEQVHQARKRTRARGQKLQNIVFMGMGEPLHHYEATRDAIRVITDHFGIMFAPRHITVSTVGLPRGIHQLGRDFDGRLQLALSLNAGTESTRKALMPITERWGMDDLKEALRAYPTRRRKYLLIEYVVLPGVTDTDTEIAGVIKWVSDLNCVVNLIPFNPFEGAPFERPTEAQVNNVSDALRAAGVAVTVRRSRGRRVSAACGQLALKAVA